MEVIDNLTTILISLFTVLFSAGAWRFYEVRMKLKAEGEKDDKTEQNMYRDDLKDRVKKLEDLLAESSAEKDEMRKEILHLTQEVSELRIKVLFLEKENERLRNI
jgi:Skp family chaperone for outer membrane proteins